MISPHYYDTIFKSWLRRDERVFSGPWLANKTEKMARITWQKLELEIPDLAIGERLKNLSLVDLTTTININFTSFNTGSC